MKESKLFTKTGRELTGIAIGGGEVVVPSSEEKITVPELPHVESPYAGLMPYERGQLEEEETLAKSMGFASVDAYRKAMCGPSNKPCELEELVSNGSIIENPDTHELIDSRTGNVLGISYEPPVGSLTMTAEAIRQFTKGGQTGAIELGSGIGLPAEQIKLNKALGLVSKFTNAVNVNRARRTRGLPPIAGLLSLDERKILEDVNEEQLEELGFPPNAHRLLGELSSEPVVSSKPLTEELKSRRRQRMEESTRRAELLEEYLSRPVVSRLQLTDRPAYQRAVKAFKERLKHG